MTVYNNHHSHHTCWSLLSTHTLASRVTPVTAQFIHCCGPTYTGRAKKSNPQEKFYISEIVADIFTKFAEFTDEDSVHISCKFY